VSDLLGESQLGLQSTDAKMRLLGASISSPITETKEGPMSVWEAIQRLHNEVKLVHALGEGHHLYLDDLRKNLPTWETTLNNLAKSYQESLSKIGTNLNSHGESTTIGNQSPASNLNPFIVWIMGWGCWKERELVCSTT
jgi:hypothetical protein